MIGEKSGRQAERLSEDIKEMWFLMIAGNLPPGAGKTSPKDTTNYHIP